jgi:hypothetical protein
MPRASLYDQVVEISTDFLGPAGERFMRRQINTHLLIEPEELKPPHLSQLVGWVRLTFAMLTDDSEHVDAFADRLLALSPGKKAYARTKHGGSR